MTPEHYALRIKLVAERNPFIADDPMALQMLAGSSQDTGTLLATTGQQYAMMAADRMSDRLRQMNPTAQRAVFARLSPVQQASLVQLGYKKPEQDEDGWLDVVGDIGGLALKPISWGLGQMAGAPIIGEALDGLAWAANKPGQLYRTIRTLDTPQQWLGLAGAVVGGVAATALAPFTGGSSLVAFGALAGGALLGAGAASAVTAPGDWARAWSATGNGEQVFERGALRKAEELLGDPRLVGLAQELTHANIDLAELAQEMAGTRDVNQNTQLSKLEEIVADMASPGTPEWDRAANAIYGAIADPTFQQAVQTLADGKISPGRDLADLFGLDSGSTLHTVISGGTDLLFTIAVDPTLALGVGTKAYRVARYGINLNRGADLAASYKAIANLPAVRRQLDVVADALTGAHAGNLQRLSSLAPSYMPLYDDLLRWRQKLISTTSRTADDAFTADDIIEYVSGQMNMQPVLQGIGNVRNTSGFVIEGISAPRMAVRQLRLEIRNLTNGLSDVNGQRKLAAYAKRENGGLFGSKLYLADEAVLDDSGRIAMPYHNSLAETTSYKIGSTLGHVPVVGRVIAKVGDALTSATTMGLTGRTISLEGPKFTRDVKAFTELGRYMGLPSWARQDIADALMLAPSSAARAEIVHGYMIDLVRMTGLEHAQGGKEFLEEFIERSRMIYGKDDVMRINGVDVHVGMFAGDQAQMVRIPNLRELEQIGRTSHLAKVFGIVDHPVAEALMSKVWKPAVLLRLGFIPRAAGEEAANFLLRGSMGHLTQEAAGRFVGKPAAYAKALEKQTLGLQLTLDEQAMIDLGLEALMPTHVRPLFHMMQRFGFEDPGQEIFTNYGKMLRRMVGGGIGGDVAANYDNWLSKIGDLNKYDLAAARAAGRPSVDLAELGWAKKNAATMADAIIMGNPYSMRRMMAGGVHSNLVEAGTEWYAKHQTTVMRSASSVNNGPVEPLYDERQLQRSYETDSRTGKIREVISVREKGRRTWYGADDINGHHAAGVHETLQRRVNDPIAGPVVADVIGRVRGTLKVDEQQLDLIARYLWDPLGASRATTTIPVVNNSDAAFLAREISLEFLDDFNPEMWQALVTRLRRRQSTQEFGDLLSRELPRFGSHTLDDVRGVLNKMVANETLRGGVGYSKLAREDAKAVLAFLDESPIAAMVAEMDKPTRAFVSQWAHTQARQGQNSWYARHLSANWPAQRPAMPLSHQRLLERTGDGANFDSLYRVVGTNEEGIEMVVLRSDAHRQLTTSVNQMLKRDLSPRARTEELMLKRSLADGEALTDEVSERLLRNHFKRIDETYPIARRPEEKWLYDSLTDAYHDVREGLKARVLDPNFHDNGVADTLRGITRNPDGSIRAIHHENPTTMLWEAPRITGMTLDELYTFAPNPALLRQNEELVQGVLATAGDRVPLVANYEVADQLHRALAAKYQVPAKRARHLRTDRAVADGRPFGAVWPAENVSGNQLWVMPKSMTEKLRMTPDDLLDPLDEWATAQATELIDSLKRRNKFALRPRSKITTYEDGSSLEEPFVHYWDEGKLTGIGSETEVTADKAERLRDHRGRPVQFGDPMFFEPAPRANPLEQDVAGDVLWEAAGPLVRDQIDSTTGNIILRSKDRTVDVARGGHVRQSSDLVMSRRARVADVSEIPIDDLPSFAIGEVRKAAKPLNLWERIVQRGFDRVIGPSIDGIIRRPMSFHAFTNRYLANKSALGFLVDPALRVKMQALNSQMSEILTGGSFDAAQAADDIRRVARVNGIDGAQHWTDAHAISFMRGYDEGEFIDLLDTSYRLTENALDAEGKLNFHATRRIWSNVAQENGTAYMAGIANNMDMEEMLKAITAALPPGALSAPKGMDWKATQEAIAESPLLRAVSEAKGWDVVKAANTNMEHVRALAGESAAIGAINDVVPYIDSHEFKTQFAENVKGMVPFWYAEENFLKRWARGLADEGLPLIRKAQLTYMGMREAGIVRTDQAGNDWFVYPGSGLLADAIDKMTLGKLDGLPIKIMFQTPTQSMLPGMNDRFGTPAFNPFVTVPMGLVSSMLPELQPIERSLIGDFAASQGVVGQVIPAHIRHIFNAALGDENSYTRYASAMTSAMAYMEAHDQGLPESATPGQLEEYMDRVREHARIIVLAQAIGGLAMPGSPSVVEDEPGGMIEGAITSFTGIGVTDAADLINDRYLSLLRTFGVEDGTAKFLELNPDATLADVINPIAYTVPRNVSASGAPIPSTNEAVAYYEDNEGFFNDNPNAAPWLLPQGEGDTRSRYAYDQQVASGMRKRRTPEEYQRALMFKKAAGQYFETKRRYTAEMDAADLRGDTTKRAELKLQMDVELELYRLANPVFAEELRSSDGLERRTRVISEMRFVVDDPDTPDAGQLPALRDAMRMFDAYTAQLAIMGLDRSAASRLAIEDMKGRYETYMDDLADRNPGIMSFWVSVLRPESSLD